MTNLIYRCGCSYRFLKNIIFLDNFRFDRISFIFGRMVKWKTRNSISLLVKSRNICEKLTEQLPFLSTSSVCTGPPYTSEQPRPLLYDDQNHAGCLASDESLPSRYPCAVLLMCCGVSKNNTLKKFFIHIKNTLRVVEQKLNVVKFFVNINFESQYVRGKSDYSIHYLLYKRGSLI